MTKQEQEDRQDVAAIFLRAAEIVDAGDWPACIAIVLAASRTPRHIPNREEKLDLARRVFDRLFKHRQSVFWWGDATKEHQQQRVLALLLARETVLNGE